MSTTKVVGIMGGMGPAATVDLMQRIIAATPATDDCDHIRTIVDNNPKVPSRIKALIEKSGPSPLATLIAMAQQLESLGSELLAMPCNTAHYYYRDLAAAVDIPFLNIMDLTSSYIAKQQPDCKRVGLLASSALSQIQLYEPSLSAQGATVVYPSSDAQAALMQLIVAVKANAGDRVGYAALQGCADDLESQGVDCLLIACTELSVISEHLNSSIATYDAADILAREVVMRALEG